jgi:hypothetical protein
MKCNNQDFVKPEELHRLDKKNYNLSYNVELVPVLHEERRDCKGQVDDSREEESEGECNLQGLADAVVLICAKQGAT